MLEGEEADAAVGVESEVEVEVEMYGGVARDGVEIGMVDRGKEEEEEVEGKNEDEVGTEATRNPRHLTAEANILSLSCNTKDGKRKDEGRGEKR